ncbi:hypothetical protein Y1Q_0009879 [Alligator mississippiensis]|uniref:Integrase p58-like C-terminal domain-containing protein n=1 Tax=Alligator mississippiensis TaxID=8496 RepID=A0A151MXA8_ALLMI|nr:hypothetical protein Y1Q_0009879 [Alligator mississippiensis]
MRHHKPQLCSQDCTCLEQRAGGRAQEPQKLRTDKLEAAWEGPHVILDKLDNVTYVVARSGEKPKTVHVNMLKPYFNRSDAVFWISSVEGSPEDPEESVTYGDWDGEAGIEELCLPDQLPSQDKDKLLTALKDFETVFSN